jgi:diguanylate cyclase (GGDEF)-like protein
MFVFRLLAAAGVALTVPFASGHLFVPDATIVAVTACFVVLALLADGAWRLARTRGATLFGLMVMADAAFLTWAMYATGGLGSPVCYLIVLEMLAVALLASYRTGLKVVIWQSLLVLAVFYGRDGGVLDRFDSARETNTIGSPWEQTLVFIGVLWVVAIATMCFSAVNERELRRRGADLGALAELTENLERESSPEGVARALVESVVSAFGFERALVLGPAGGDDGLAPLVWHGSAKPDAPGALVGPGSVLALASSERRTQLITQLDPSVDSWLDALLPDARNLIVVPLTADSGVVGTLVVEHHNRVGSRIERRLVNIVERFAAHGALALRNAWLLEEVRDLAANDPLTGLANRMTFGDSLDRELARAARDRGAVTLVMLDIDHFKKLNDSRGHQAGDQVLRQTAETLREQQRAYDVAARYGGEEFVLIAPGLTWEDAPATAERIREAIEGNGCGVTASVGIATFPRDATSADGLIAAADTALYASKHAGRNRVSQAPPLESRQRAAH